MKASIVGKLVGHYRIVEILGEGGMGVVYKGEDTKLDRPVAIKFLGRGPLTDEKYQAAFLREAKTAAALNHPNVCTIHEVDDFQGEVFIVMEYVAGKTLKEHIADKPLRSTGLST